MKTNLEYCAQHFLQQWIANEKRLYAVLNGNGPSGVLDSLSEAITYFQVARSLPRKYDVERGLRRYEPLLRAFHELPQSSTYDNDFVELVDRFQRRIGSSYGGRNLISLSSKLLWLRFRDPFIIYDSRVRGALKLTSTDYGEFVERWLSSFEQYESQIARVCSFLPSILRYLVADSEAVEDEVAADCSEPWFHRRVFDIFLWHEGG
jgi:hypothetical protein